MGVNKLNPIYILEGIDGSGKTTLANAIAAKTKGHILHSSFNKKWDIEEYHTDIIESALILAQYQPVIIDRWAPSEFVYSTVFRDGVSYDTGQLIEEYFNNIKYWIYCRSDNAVENHLKNKTERIEMFEDMADVIDCFDEYVQYTKNNWIHIPWKEYDFEKLNIKEFVESIT